MPRRASGLIVLGAGLLVFLRPLAFSAPGRSRLSRAAEGTSAAVVTEEDQYAEMMRKKKEETLEAIQKASEQDAPVGEDLGKFWVNQPGQLSFEIQFNRGDRVKDLRLVVQKVTGIPPEAQEIRANGELINKEGQFLEALDLSDIWVMDDRDDSPERGEWNPDPEEDMSPWSSPLKIGVYLFTAVLTIFWVTQIAGVNPYANWPEGPRLNWDEIPEDLRPGREPMQRPQALGIEERKQQMMLEERKKSMF